MRGNGVWTTKGNHPVIPQGIQRGLYRAPIECPVEAAGTSKPGTANRRIAVNTGRRTGSAPWAFVWPEVHRAKQANEKVTVGRRRAEPADSVPSDEER